MRAEAALVVLLAAASAGATEVTLTEGTNLSVDVAPDGRLVTDLLGSVWIVPQSGGEAERIEAGPRPVSRPRWGPAGERIVYQAATGDGTRIALYDLERQSGRLLGAGGYADRQPAWHPDGERIVFSSARDATGFDIWELDLPTGLAWRLSSRPGDESEPAWSADGRHLVYVHELEGRWSLIMRRHGQPEEILLMSDEPLAAPSWRPDGSLLTYLRRAEDGWRVRMTILSEPRLHRPLMKGEDFFLSPVAWRDRQSMVYAANGHLRERPFDAWSSKTIPFRAHVTAEVPLARSAPAQGQRELPRSADGGDLILRAERLFDGTGASYREDVDIIIEDGVIAAVEAARERDRIVVNLGDATVLPGLIDAYARLPADADAGLGPLLLASGITTLVAEHARADTLRKAWQTRATPGPRLLDAAAATASPPDDDLPWLVVAGDGADDGHVDAATGDAWQARGVPLLAGNWQTALATGAPLVLTTHTRPASPAGIRYRDLQIAGSRGPVTIVSGLADAATPGLDDIRLSRVARLIGGQLHAERRFATPQDLSAAAPTVVLGSHPNGLPAGAGLHAELRALVAAGLSPAAALKAAGVNAAAALRLGLKAGRVAPGAVADLVVVAGDPLSDIGAVQDVIAVVRNGRFYSTSGLIDLADAAPSVGIFDSR